MGETILVQTELRSGTTRLTCWLDPKAKVGDQVTLKVEPGRRWDVVAQYARQPASSINRGWDNNI